MGQVGGVLALDGDVVLQRDVADLDVIEGPGAQDPMRMRASAGVVGRRLTRETSTLWRQRYAAREGDEESVLV